MPYSVAIIFDATRVNPATVSLDGQDVRVRGNGNSQASIKDVNNDGMDDLVLQIEDVDGTYQAGTSTGILSGETYESIFNSGKRYSLHCSITSVRL